LIVYIGMALAGLILVVIVLKIYRTKQYHSAAMNVVFAKYTYSKLSKNKQELVRDAAKDLVLGSNTKLRGFANEVERYGWYALAMEALAIPSQVPENPAWNRVKNPYVAIHPGNSMFRAVTGYLKKEYGIDVKISDVKIDKKNAEQTT